MSTSWVAGVVRAKALAGRRIGAGGARALRRADVGQLAPGARADLVLLDAPSHAYLAYRPGVPLAAAVWQAGRLAWQAAGKPLVTTL